jgi:hypothetical protein
VLPDQSYSTPQESVINDYTAITGMEISWAKEKKSDRNLFECHSDHHEYNIKPSDIELEAAW